MGNLEHKVNNKLWKINEYIEAVVSHWNYNN